MFAFRHLTILFHSFCSICWSLVRFVFRSLGSLILRMLSRRSSSLLRLRHSNSNQSAGTFYWSGVGRLMYLCSELTIAACRIFTADIMLITSSKTLQLVLMFIARSKVTIHRPDAVDHLSILHRSTLRSCIFSLDMHFGTMIRYDPRWAHSLLSLTVMFSRGNKKLEASQWSFWKHERKTPQKLDCPSVVMISALAYTYVLAYLRPLLINRRSNQLLVSLSANRDFLW